MKVAGGLAVGGFLTILMGLILVIFWYQILFAFPTLLVLLLVLVIVLTVGVCEPYLTTPRPPDQDDPPKPRGLSTPSARGTIEP